MTGRRILSALAACSVSCGGLVETSSGNEDPGQSGGQNAAGGQTIDNKPPPGGTGGQAATGSGGSSNGGLPGGSQGHPAVGAWSVVGSERLFDFADPVWIESVASDKIVGRVSGPHRYSIRSGSSSGLQLSFLLQDPPAETWFEVVAAEDGSRMTGKMAPFMEPAPPPADIDPTIPITFIAFDLERYASWKGTAGTYQRFRRYELEAKSFTLQLLTTDATLDPQFTEDTTYRLHFHREWMTGDFGNFHAIEMTIPENVGDPIQVGPVALTDSSLPVEMELRFDGVEPPTLFELSARTSSGGEYVFQVTESDLN